MRRKRSIKLNKEKFNSTFLDCQAGHARQIENDKLQNI